MTHSVRLMLAAGLWMLAAACSLAPNPEPTIQPPSPTVFPSTRVPTGTPVPPTAAPLPISPACLPAADNAAGLEMPPAYSGYPAAVLEYLNAGGSPVQLSDLLNQFGVAAQPVSVAVADYTGDGRDDVAVAIIDPEADDLDGRLLVFNCGVGEYRTGLNMAAGLDFFRGFHIWFWQDMDADRKVELIVSQGFCGAHTCFDDLMVLSWDGAGFVDRLDGSTAELPYPAVRIADPDGDGIFQIEIATGGFGSVGAGPQRPVTYIYKRAAGAEGWKLSETRPDPSPFRIHVLHDADDAAARADYAYALQLYRRVIEESGLDDWVAGVEGARVLAAYARYRIAVIAVAVEDGPAVEAAFTELWEAYPLGDPLHDFVQMAILFRNAYASGGLGAACVGAAGFAESHADLILAPLGSQAYGYANRDYTGESMCPAPVLGD